MSVQADEIWAILREVASEQKALQVAQKETDDKFKETDRKLQKLSELLGNIGNNQGDVAEEFFFNSLVEDAHLGAIHFDDVATNMKKHKGKIQEEYDLVMTNGEAVGIIEVKYKAHQNDVDTLERKMRHFKLLFPWFKDYKIYGALAAFNVNDVAKKEALDRGFFVLQRKGDVLHTDCGEHLMVL